VYPRIQSVELVETLLDLIKSSLSSGEDVLVSGFGKFCVKAKRERRGQESGNRRGYDAGRKAGSDV
jgi:integration host factor subunit alpha